jgi:cellulose synthase/poly-beta-1,6-N-acetylglucosamine synthase-like glycosyltransferase
VTWAEAAMGARAAVGAVFEALQWPVLAYFLLLNTSYLVLVLLAAWQFGHHLRRLGHSGREDVLTSKVAPRVSVIVPTFNEEAGIVASAQSLLSLRYPDHEVVIVDDGSTDATYERLRQAFDLVEIERELADDVPTRARLVSVNVPRAGAGRLLVVRKENSGKSDAVNMGINASSGDLVLFVDADSVLEPDALLTVTQPFTADPTRVVATGGVVRPSNGCRVLAGRIVEVRRPSRLLERIQVVEYLRAFLLGRTGWSRLGALILISGAFGAYRRDVLTEVGGLDGGTLGEDFELAMRIHRRMREQQRDYRVEFVAEPVCWTEVPPQVGVLQRQRSRWHRGLWETLWKHRRMLGNPTYGRVGLLAVPYSWTFELVAPALELLGLVLVTVGLALGVVSPAYVLLFLAVAYGYAILVTLAAMAVEELTFHKYPRWRDLGSLVVASVAENLGYRQMTAWWRLRGWWDSLRRRRPVWGAMPRVGMGGAEEGAPSRGAA